MTNGKTLDKLPLPTFTVESDLFALAEHIFALLMNGCHPFACASSNPNVFPQPVDNIRNGFTPVFQKQSGLTIPAYAPEISILPKNIQQYFFRAFVDGNKNPKARPTAEEWYTVLREMKNHLCLCSRNSRHIFSDHLSSCPWCRVNSRMNTVYSKPQPRPQPHPNPAPQRSSSSNSGCAIIFFIALVVAGIILFVMNNNSSNNSSSNYSGNNIGFYNSGSSNNDSGSSSSRYSGNRSGYYDDNSGALKKNNNSPYMCLHYLLTQWNWMKQ